MTKNKKKRVRKPLRELTLMDRFLFDEAMSKPVISRMILSIILGEEISPIRIGITEKAEEPYYGSRAVRLDLLAFDENDVVYDAEAQKKNTGKRNLKRRSRLYQAHIDVNLMEPGELNFKNMNDAYVIFIAPFDLFGMKKYKYTFRMTCDEIPEMALDDGAVRIFLNSHGENDDEVSPELVEFLHFMENTSWDCKEFKNDRVRELADQIDRLKDSQEVGVKYMRYWEEIAETKEEARAEGRAEERVDVIRKFMKNMNISIEKALEILEIPENEHPMYIELVNNIE